MVDGVVVDGYSPDVYVFLFVWRSFVMMQTELLICESSARRIF